MSENSPLTSEEGSGIPEETPLEREFVVWAHRRGGSNYGSNMEALGSFKSIEGFWRYVSHLPPPSDMFFGDRRYGDMEIEALSVFEKGVRPEWEDPRNMYGGEFNMKKIMQGGQLGACGFKPTIHSCGCC